MKPWAYRRRGVVCTRTLDSVRFFFRFDYEGKIVKELCLGERYAHVSPGLVFEYECYRGSCIDNWHGGPTGSLTDLVRWVADAEQPELGFSLWMLE